MFFRAIVSLVGGSVGAFVYVLGVWLWGWGILGFGIRVLDVFVFGWVGW